MKNQNKSITKPRTPKPRITKPLFATRHEMFSAVNETLCEVAHAEDRLNEKLVQHAHNVEQRCKHANVACWCALAISIVAVAFAVAALSEVIKV